MAPCWPGQVTEVSEEDKLASEYGPHVLVRLAPLSTSPVPAETKEAVLPGVGALAMPSPAARLGCGEDPVANVTPSLATSPVNAIPTTAPLALPPSSPSSPAVSAPPPDKTLLKVFVRGNDGATQRVASLRVPSVVTLQQLRRLLQKVPSTPPLFSFLARDGVRSRRSGLCCPPSPRFCEGLLLGCVLVRARE